MPLLSLLSPAAPLFLADILVPMPRNLCKKGGGDGSFHVWQGTQMTLHLGGQVCHPLGEGGLQDMSGNTA